MRVDRRRRAAACVMAGLAVAVGIAASSAQDALGGASASAGFDGSSARLLLQVQGQGAVEQWIRSGSVGQSVMLTSDGQQVSNRLNIELVRQSVGDNAQLAQNVAQAIVFARGVGGHF